MASASRYKGFEEIHFNAEVFFVVWVIAFPAALPLESVCHCVAYWNTLSLMCSAASRSRTLPSPVISIPMDFNIHVSVDIFLRGELVTMNLKL